MESFFRIYHIGASDLVDPFLHVPFRHRCLNQGFVPDENVPSYHKMSKIEYAPLFILALFPSYPMAYIFIGRINISYLLLWAAKVSFEVACIGSPDPDDQFRRFPMSLVWNKRIVVEEWSRPQIKWLYMSDMPFVQFFPLIFT